MKAAEVRFEDVKRVIERDYSTHPLLPFLLSYFKKQVGDENEQR